MASSKAATKSSGASRLSSAKEVQTKGATEKVPIPKPTMTGTPASKAVSDTIGCRGTDSRLDNGGKAEGTTQNCTTGQAKAKRTRKDIEEHEPGNDSDRPFKRTIGNLFDRKQATSKSAPKSTMKSTTTIAALTSKVKVKNKKTVPTVTRKNNAKLSEDSNEKKSTRILGDRKDKKATCSTASTKTNNRKTPASAVLPRKSGGVYDNTDGAIHEEDNMQNDKSCRRMHGGKLTVERDSVRKRKTPSKPPIAKQSIPRSYPECGRADKALIDMKDAGEDWDKIIAKYEEISGTSIECRSTLPNRYNRMKMHFVTVNDADAIVLFKAKLAVDKEMADELWQRVADRVEQLGGMPYTPDALFRNWKRLSLAGDVVAVQAREGQLSQAIDEAEPADDKRGEDNDEFLEDTPGQEAGSILPSGNQQTDGEAEDRQLVKYSRFMTKTEDE